MIGPALTVTTTKLQAVQQAILYIKVGFHVLNDKIYTRSH